MKRHLGISILVAALAAPAANAGSDIVKCVDGTGHVTLTDQACDNGTTTVRLASMPAAEAPARAEPYPLVAETATLPPPSAQRRAVMPRIQQVKAKPMMRDVATLKAARAQFLLMDASPKQTLATLN